MKKPTNPPNISLQSAIHRAIKPASPTAYSTPLLRPLPSISLLKRYGWMLNDCHNVLYKRLHPAFAKQIDAIVSYFLQKNMFLSIILLIF